MFGSHSKRASAYSSIGVETGITSASPHKLIIMLYDGAILAISSANIAMEHKDIPAKGQAISKAIEIISNGLQVSLNHEVGGDLVARLDALYTYMVDRLLYANLHNSTAALNEVSALLSGLREAWESIGEQATLPA